MAQGSLSVVKIRWDGFSGCQSTEVNLAGFPTCSVGAAISCFRYLKKKVQYYLTTR